MSEIISKTEEKQNSSFETLEKEAVEKLKKVFDPEIPVNIYDLGLIYSIDFKVVENYTHARD